MLPEDFTVHTDSANPAAPNTFLVTQSDEVQEFTLSDRDANAVAIEVAWGAFVEIILDGTNKTTISCTTVDATCGKFSFVLDPSILATPGIYTGRIFVREDSADNASKIKFNKPCYLEKEATLTQLMEGCRPLTLAEVRLYMRDYVPLDGCDGLLDDVEFTDIEIVQCMLRTVDRWNEASPVMARHIYTVGSFPYRNILLEGTLSFLYDIASRSYERDRLPYSAGGMTIDDKNKSQSYIRFAESAKQTFEERLAEKKRSLNMMQFFGSTRLGY